MTSSLATNYISTEAVESQYFLKSDKNGFPLQKQIPKTYLIFSQGTGTINYTGETDIIVDGSTLTGPVIIDITDAKNHLGRSVNIQIIAPINQTITLQSAPTFMKLNGTSLQQFTHVIPGDNKSKTVTIHFYSTEYFNVDYGGSINTLIPPTSLPASIIPTPIIRFIPYYGPWPLNPLDFGKSNNFFQVNYYTDLDGGVVNGQQFYPPTRPYGNVGSKYAGMLHCLCFQNIPGSTTTGSYMHYKKLITIPYTAINYVSARHCFFSANILGQRGIYTGNDNNFTPVYIPPNGNVHIFTTSLYEGLIFYVNSNTPTLIGAYDPIIQHDWGNVFAPPITTKIQCLSFNHETLELYVFSTNRTAHCFVITYGVYMRGLTPVPSFHDIAYTDIGNPIDPAINPNMVNVALNPNSRVLSCAFDYKNKLCILTVRSGASPLSQCMIISFATPTFVGNKATLTMLPIINEKFLSLELSGDHVITTSPFTYDSGSLSEGEPYYILHAFDAPGVFFTFASPILTNENMLANSFNINQTVFAIATPLYGF